MWEQATGALWHSHWLPWWGPRGILFNVGGLFTDKAVHENPWGDALQPSGSDAASKSLWRWKFAEIWQILRYVMYLP